MRLTVHPRTLPLRSPFRIHHESRTEQPTLSVELTDTRTGISGLGEAPMTRYYGLRSDEQAAVLHRLAPAFAPLHLPHPPAPAPAPLPPAALVPTVSPFLRCALDVALHDLWAKQHDRPLHALWNAPQPRQTPTCYTIGMGSIEEMVAKLRAFPWPVYKIKLGGRSDALATIRALRGHTDAPFYVDANTGWTARQTIDLSGPLAELGVMFLEQPLPTTDTAGQREVFRHSALPVLADESCQTEADVDACAEHFHGINIKAVKCGGLRPARRMIARARVLGLEVMVGCMTESSVGISGLAHLLPELDYADMDGAMLIGEDPAVGVTFDGSTGYAVYAERAGTGAKLLSNGRSKDLP